MLADALLQADRASKDLTAEALGISDRKAAAVILAGEGGVVAGLAEVSYLLQKRGVEVAIEKNDGDVIRPGDTVLRAEGSQAKLLALERVGLNLLQRMSGIATAAHCLQERVQKHSPSAWIVGTRKTPWSLVDKRALHLGGAGTHRLNLGDAILIKNNHLALLAAREEDAAPIAIERAWNFRKEAAFIEVEVRSEGAARAAAKTFRRLLEETTEDYPCLVMLDNMEAAQAGAVVEMLRREQLWDYTLVEASGRISAGNVEAYAASGVDAISVGSLTHSVRALDLSQKIS